jgi:molybdopterin-guanine dinucleotide biosynthesis protein
VEGYKHGPFPKIEVYRKAAGRRPVYDASDPAAAALFLAIVTDDSELAASCPVISLDPHPAGSHVAALADLLADLTPKPQHGA